MGSWTVGRLRRHRERRGALVKATRAPAHSAALTLIRENAGTETLTGIPPRDQCDEHEPFDQPAEPWG